MPLLSLAWRVADLRTNRLDIYGLLTWQVGGILTSNVLFLNIVMLCLHGDDILNRRLYKTDAIYSAVLEF